MALLERYARFRDIIEDCAGYVILVDDNTIHLGDETVCASTLIIGTENWTIMGAEFHKFFGRTVRDMNDYKHNTEMDVHERLFRRRF